MTMRHFVVIAALALAACQDDGASPAEEPGTRSAESAAVENGGALDTTATIPCSFDGIVPTDACEAEITRKWGNDGSTLVEITKPDGFTRAIFINADGTPFSADSAEADGSAAWDFTATMNGDKHVIDFGPEHYEFADAFITGG